MPDGPKFSLDADDDWEILHLIDIHALLRRPTWDGVMILLILPLTQGVLN
ncbi:hypothetical protein P692DRAFT_20880706 [Suillus brevipes Sb2]|nr:hypothetical protein P692DRAFT_20880706 [Suillus brevipes Sb2]